MHMDVAALAIASLGASEKQAGIGQLLDKGLGAIGKGLRGGTKAVAKYPGRLAGKFKAENARQAATSAVKAAPSVVPSAPTANAALGAATHAAAPAASFAANAAARAAPRSFASRLGRTTAAAGAVGAGAVGAGHANNYVQEYGVKVPLVGQVGGKDPYASYREHQNREGKLLQSATQRLSDLVPGSEEYQKALAETENGSYGSSWWSLGGLNPWADPGIGHHREVMNNRKAQVSGDFENATNDFANSRKSVADQMAKIQTRLGDKTLLPQQRQFYQTQLDSIKQHLDSMGTQSPQAARIREQAQGAGMIMPGDPFPSPGGLGAASAGAALATPGQPTTAPGIPRATPDPISTPAPNSNPLLVGGATNAPLTPVNFSQVPKWK